MTTTVPVNTTAPGTAHQPTSAGAPPVFHPPMAAPTAPPSVFPGYDASYVTQFRLPSHGLPYVDEHGNPLLPDEGTVNVRMMTGDEDAIINSGDLNFSTKITRIINACSRVVTTSGQLLPPERLITTDRLLLMVYIRSHSLGSKYRLPGTCPECAREFDHEFDILNDMDIEEMPRKRPVKLGTGEIKDEDLVYAPKDGIEITLPLSKYKLRLRLLTGSDEDWIAAEAEKGPRGFLKTSFPGAPEWYLMMLRKIKAIQRLDGGWDEILHESLKDMQKLLAFVRKLPLADCNFIKAQYADWDVGVNQSLTATCPSCQGEVLIPFRVTGEFFHPTVG